MSQQQNTVKSRPAYVYLLALALALVLSIDKAHSDIWAFNGQDITIFALLFYGTYGMGKRLEGWGR